MFEKQIDESTEVSISPSVSYSSCFSKIVTACWPTFFYWILTYITYPFYSELLSDTPTLLFAYQFSFLWIESFIKIMTHSMNNGFCVLASQAAGANELRLIGYYLHKAVLVCFSTSFFAFVVAVSASLFFLRALRYNSEITVCMLQYMVYSLGAILLNGLFGLARSFVIARKNFCIPLPCQAIGTIIEIGLSLYFVKEMELGLLGIGISKTIAEAIRLLVIAAYVKQSKTFEESVFFLSKDSLEGFWTQYWSQMKNAASILAESVFIQCVFVLTTETNYDDRESSLEFFQILVFPQFLIVSLGEALGVHVANAIGEKLEDKARLFIRAGTLVSLITIAIVELLIFALRNAIPNALGGGAEVVQTVKMLMLAYCACFPFDLFHKTLGFVGRAVGKEVSVFVRLMLCTVIGGLMVGSLYYMHDESIYWVWVGVTITYAVATVALGRIISRTDFAAQVEMIIEKLTQNGKEHVSVELSKI